MCKSNDSNKKKAEIITHWGEFSGSKKVINEKIKKENKKKLSF